MRNSDKKTGVLLIQLGTPDTAKKADVKTYLKEFLNDPRVIDSPKGWLRSFLVNGIIIPKRLNNSTKSYEELWKFGNGISPLLTHSLKQKDLLQARFTGENVYFHLAMRYRNPSMEAVLAEMKQQNYDQIIVLPMFPQYASATSGTGAEKTFSLMANWWALPEIATIGDYYDHPDYIKAWVEKAQEFDINSYDQIMFSYHGLPLRHVHKIHPQGTCESLHCKTEINEENKFCYQAQCYATTRAIAKALELSEDRYTVAFQSRMDNHWLEPFADKTIKKWGKQGHKRALVFSPAFVADCLETIIEIQDEYEELFKEAGGQHLQLVPSLNESATFIDCLEDLVRKRLIK